MAVLVLDARDGVTQQDKHIAGQIVEAGRGCVIIVNKWDLAAQEERKTSGQRSAVSSQRKKAKSFRDEYCEAVRRELFFLDWAPVLPASALTGQAVAELFPWLGRVEQELDRRVETPALNHRLRRCLESNPPPRVGGRRLKVYYAFQKPGRPPTFVLFANQTGGLTGHYRRYLTEKIRAAWGFAGCPVRLELRARPRRRRGAGRAPEKKSG
jgi:GTP-binding protein